MRTKPQNEIWGRSLTGCDLHIRIFTVPQDVKCGLFLSFSFYRIGYAVEQISFLRWPHVLQVNWSWPISGILINLCHFCFLQNLFLMQRMLSIFFGFGSRITAFIWWICTGKNSLHSSRVQECMLNKLFYLCYLSVQWFRIA